LTARNFTGLFRMGNDEDIFAGGDITITLDSTYDNDTTFTYDIDSSISTLDLSNIISDSDTIDIDHIITTSRGIGVFDTLSIKQIENMCKEYPALEKVWRNFKSVYDMTIQDYKGKMKEQGFDDDIPF